MTAPAALIDPRPIAVIGRPAGGRRPHQRRAVMLAGGEWLRLARQRVSTDLDCAVGLTRCSPITVTAHPPILAAAALEDVADVVDPMALEGARIALEATTARSMSPWLWLFVAECDVLWPQRAWGALS